MGETQVATGEAQAKDYYRTSFAKRFGRLADKPYLDVHVVDHCNLRCRGCIHFAPLAERRFLDEGDYARDLAMLSGVAGIEGYFRAVVLMGGEQLLHPRLPEVMRLTRRYLPSTPVLLSSNGLLLRRMSDEFWETLVDCGIELTLSAYPLGMDYQALLELARQRGVVAGLASDRTERDRGKEVFFKLALDPTGSQDERHSFVNCTFGGCYPQLARGALWPCQVAAHHGSLARGASRWIWLLAMGTVCRWMDLRRRGRLIGFGVGRILCAAFATMMPWRSSNGAGRASRRASGSLTARMPPPLRAETTYS